MNTLAALAIAILSAMSSLVMASIDTAGFTGDSTGATASNNLEEESITPISAPPTPPISPAEVAEAEEVVTPRPLSTPSAIDARFTPANSVDRGLL
jgi:hypothetical protein